MDETEFQEILTELFLENGDFADVRSFEDAWLVTRNRGIVVDLPDGSQFQVTIVKSK